MRSGSSRGSDSPSRGEHPVKAEIAARIASMIERRGLTQAEAARLLGLVQPDVSKLMRGKLGGFSTDRLFRFLNALGQDVEIHMSGRAHARRAGRLTVVADGARSATRGRR